MERKNASHSKGDSEKKGADILRDQVVVCSSPSAPPEKGSLTNTVERERERLERTNLKVYVCECTLKERDGKTSRVAKDDDDERVTRLVVGLN